MPEIGDQNFELDVQDSRPPDDHECCALRRRTAGRPIRFTKPPPRAIALRRAADLPTHCEPDATRSLHGTPEHDESRTIDSLALLEQRLEIGAAGQPLAPAEAAGQTVSRLRPLLRRRFKTFRPPWVFIRSRKPCVFARRRRFGWNVRFIV